MSPGSRRALAATVILAVAILALAMSPVPAKAFPYEIQGYLKDADGSPIRNAQIALTGTVFNITSQNLEPATIIITTDAEGFYNVNIGVNEPGGMEPDQIVTLKFDDGERSVSEDLGLTGIGAWVNLTVKKGFDPVGFLTSPLGAVILVIILTIIVIVLFNISHKQDEEVKTEEAKRRPGRRRE